MFNVCHKCGMYRADKIIDLAGPYAICPECGHAHTFLALPLMIISGASGAGKSAVCNALLGQCTNAVLLDSDILWRSAFNTPEDNYRDFFETWLRMSKNIGQSGRPVVLFGAGMGVPGNIEPRIERRYFSAVHYLALTCDDATLIERLRTRPQWRASASDAFIESQVSFNRWFRETGPTLNPPIVRLDTTNTAPGETAAQVMSWIKAISDQPSAFSLQPSAFSDQRSAKYLSVEELLARVGLAKRMTHVPNQMSGGERQRVAIARALANEPALVLADEPTGNLDSQSGADVITLLRQLNRDLGTTIIIVTHDPAVARQTDRVLVMRDGQIADDHRVGHPFEEDLKEFRSSGLGKALLDGDPEALTWLASSGLGAIQQLFNRE